MNSVKNHLTKRFFIAAIFTVFMGIALNTSYSNAAVKKEISDNELIGCTGNGTLKIGNKISSISQESDTWMDADIEKVMVSSGNKNFKTSGGVLYNKKMTKLIYYPNNKKGDIFTIPKSVKIIANGAFSYNRKLKEVVISEGVTTIQETAFMASNIETVSIPSTAKTFGDGIFYDCIKLKSVKNLSNMSEIPYGMFENCKNLEEFAIGNNVVSIGAKAFYKCQNLGSVYIPATVTGIGEDAFYESTLYFEVSKESKSYLSEDGVLFSGAGKRLEYYPVRKAGKYSIPDRVEEINETAFTGSIGLTELSLNETLTEFSMSLLDRCYNLEEINISANLEKLNLEKDTFNRRYNLGRYNIKKINVSDENKYFKSYEGALYSYDYKNLYLIPFGADKLILHENIEYINPDMCQNNFNSIELPETNRNYTVYNGVLYDKNITKIIIFPSKIVEYSIPSTVSDISVITNRFGLDDNAEEPVSYNNMAYNLQNIFVEESNPYFSEDDGILYNKDMSELLLYPQMKQGKCVIPVSVKRVSRGAFASATKLTEINFSGNVDYASIVINDCTSLERIIFDNEIDDVFIYGKLKFGEHSDLNIKEIYLPGKLSGISIDGLNKSVQFYGYNNTGEYTKSHSMEIKGVKAYLTNLGYKYKSLGSAPKKKITGAKASVNGNNVKIVWNKMSDADGFTIFVDNGKIEYTLKNISNGNKNSCTINKSKFDNWDNSNNVVDGIIIDETGNDTAYMFIRPYKIINGVKAYGKTTYIVRNGI